MTTTETLTEHEPFTVRAADLQRGQVLPQGEIVAVRIRPRKRIAEVSYRNFDGGYGAAHFGLNYQVEIVADLLTPAAAMDRVFDSLVFDKRRPSDFSVSYTRYGFDASEAGVVCIRASVMATEGTYTKVLLTTDAGPDGRVDTLGIWSWKTDPHSYYKIEDNLGAALVNLHNKAMEVQS